MAGEVPMACRNLETIGRSESGSFMIFEFWEEGEELLESSCDSEFDFNFDEFVDEDEDDDDENAYNIEKSKEFWESHHELLKTNIRRSALLESQIRKATKAALEEVNTDGVSCVCRIPIDGCRNCLQREISDHLQNAGFNCAICKAKWKSSPEIPAGEHTYMEVMGKSSSKKEEVRVIIELNFQAEFEMARANEEYNRLISGLPEIYVGKPERLKNVIKILCSAAKKCMKEKKMHMAPWRKQKYMQSKWLGTCEKKMSTPIEPIVLNFERPVKQKRSMLTFDLPENLPKMHRSSSAVQLLW